MMIRNGLAFTLIWIAMSNFCSAGAESKKDCAFYNSSSELDEKGAIAELLNQLPQFSSVVICPTAKRVDGIFVLSPIVRDSGVSYFVSAYFETPEAQSITPTDLVKLTAETPLVQSTMMALSADPIIDHSSKKFVETESISIGTFKYMFRLWQSVVEMPSRARNKLDISSLDVQGKSSYWKFIGSLKGSSGSAIIKSIVFSGNNMLEFPPRLSIEIESNQMAWRIDFDLTESKKVAIFEVAEQVE